MEMTRKAMELTRPARMRDALGPAPWTKSFLFFSLNQYEQSCDLACCLFDVTAVFTSATLKPRPLFSLPFLQLQYCTGPAPPYRQFPLSG